MMQALAWWSPLVCLTTFELFLFSPFFKVIGPFNLLMMTCINMFTEMGMVNFEKF